MDDVTDSEKHFLTTEDHDNIKRRPKCRPMAVIAVVCIALLAFLLLVSLFVILGLGLHMSSNVCLSGECVELAFNVIKGMNRSVDPCVDFYQYTCGGWDYANVLPEGYGIWSKFGILNKRNHIAIKKLLDGSELDDVRAIKLARNVYKSCMDLTGLTYQGAEPILRLINSTGGWDLIGLRNATAPSWSPNSANFVMSKLLGNHGFFKFKIIIDDKNSSQYVSSLKQDGLTLPSELLYTDPRQINNSIPALRKYITSILKLLGPSVDDDVYSQAADNIISFETDLAKIYISKVELRDPVATYNRMTLADLSSGSYWRQFNWTTFVTDYYRMSNVTGINDQLPVIVQTPAFFQALSDVYSKYNETVHENYFKWHLFHHYVTDLGSDFLIPYYKFDEAIRGSGEKERYITCVTSITKVVPMSIARLYTDYVLSPGTKERVARVVHEIRLAFEQRLMSNSFLDQVTKERSIWKVGNISEMIAYPSNISNNAYLLDRSKAIINGEGDYFETIKWHNILDIHKNLQKLGKPVDKKEWQLPPTNVNAYYEPKLNEFVFLEGILNPPFFEANWPDYFTFGALGTVVGHELTHGFDDQGQQYDQYGVLKQWWTSESVEAFKTRTTCFVDQYSKYSVFGYNINGNLTQGENIADNGGLKTSFQAYKNSIGQSTPQLLPATASLTQDQLFFIAFGQTWCTIYSEQFITTNLKVNPHSPGPFRVNGAVSNNEQFAKAFNCPVGSPMNPRNKCNLW